MSHFTVLAIGNDIEGQMAPYEESTENPEYRSFKSTEREDMIEYMTGTMTLVTLPDGTTTNEYDSNYRVFDTKGFGSEYVFPEGTVKEEKKFCEVFKTFEQYKLEWCGSEERDSEMGEYGYWHNENAKWDWYQVGGRWSGFFKLKAGAVGELGEPGVFKNTPKAGWVDSAKIKDIDFDGMKQDAMNNANKEYEKLEEVLKGRALPSWQKILKEQNDDVEKARDIYHADPVKKELWDAGIHVFGDYAETFKNSRQEFVDDAANNVAMTYALLKDGQWYQKGKMGWFGMSSDEKDQGQWNEEVWKMIESLPEDTVLTVLDCHI
jgi:hypothetical protein